MQNPPSTEWIKLFNVISARTHKFDLQVEAKSEYKGCFPAVLLECMNILRHVLVKNLTNNFGTSLRPPDGNFNKDRSGWLVRDVFEF